MNYAFLKLRYSAAQSSNPKETVNIHWEGGDNVVIQTILRLENLDSVWRDFIQSVIGTDPDIPVKVFGDTPDLFIA